ncbi:MAG: serine hydrolase [Phormidesmis sp.]
MPAKFFLPNAELQSTLEHVLEETWQTFPQLAQNQIAVTWIAYEPPYRVNTGGALSAEEFWRYQPQGASYRGVELVDPESVAKLFYLVAMHVWLEQGMVQPAEEIARALTDMMVDNSHDALSYVLDVLSGTTSGPSLPPGPFETWQSQRNIVSRYFQQLGWPELRALNLNQKIWCDRPYGRERDSLGKTLENRNQLTAEAIARLLHSIVGGVSVSSARSQQMMALLQRPSYIANRPFQPQRFIDKGLPNTARVWSQAGVSHRVRHDAAYIEASDRHPYLLVILTEGEDQSANSEIIPFVSERILAAMSCFETT